MSKEASIRIVSDRVLFTMAILLPLALGSPLTAQSDSAQISGYVTDTSKATVPNAAVIITNEDTSLERRTNTNQAGYYVVAGLQPGFYELTVEAPGFKRYRKNRNKLDPSIAKTIDARLEVGPLTQTLNVVASAASVQSETATVGRLIERSQIENLMLNGRDPIQLALLKPGVRANGSLAEFTFGLNNGQFSINGSREEDNLITFDGAPGISTRANLTSISVADADTVQEMQVLTANYSAEYGRSNGGQIRIVTRSGTSDFHGGFYEYFRNSALDANAWARNRVANDPSISGAPEAFRYNQFGYNLSGPVYIPGKFNTQRNKLFWLWAQEWVRFRRERSAMGMVPSPAMRSGNFSELLDPANPFFRRVRLVNDPTSGQPFANNVIPASQLSRNGLGLLRAYPQPTPGFLQGTANWTQTRPAPVNQRKDTISVDFLPAARHSFRFRVLNFSYFDLNPFFRRSDAAGRIFDRHNQIASISHTWTISPTVVNEFLVTGSVGRNEADIDRSHDRWQRTQYGIDYPYLFPTGKEIPDRIPTFSVQNFAIVDGTAFPGRSAAPIYAISNNTTKVLSQHTFKFGFLFERAGQNNFDIANRTVPFQNGLFNFDDLRAGGTTSGLAIANVALGLFTSYGETGPKVYAPYRSHMVEWFAQDSWKIGPRVRLELGLRHSIVQPYYSQWRNLATFDPRFYDPAGVVVQDPRTGEILSGDRLNGIVIPGDGWPESARGRVPIAFDPTYDRLFRGVPKEYSQMHYGNFQPRIGVAILLTPETVIRGGFGKFLNRPGVTDQVPLAANPPISPVSSITNGNVDRPGAVASGEFPLALGIRDEVYKIPSAYNWNLTVERNIGFQAILEVAYVGRTGLWLPRQRDVNQLPAGTIQANQGVNPDVLRPYKGYGPLQMEEHAARSIYHGLQIGLNRRFVDGLSFGAAYTWSKSMDNASRFREALPNSFDDRNMWGPSSFDTPHVLVVNFIYDLPFFRNSKTRKGKLLGGWQIIGVTQAQTGTPFSVSTGNDFAGVGAGGGQQLWNVTGNVALPKSERQFSSSPADQNFYFSTTAPDGTPIFSAPNPGTFGNQTRNLYRGPGFQNWNLSLMKEFAVAENHRLVLRWEAYNWPNHPDWSAATANPRSGVFGKVTGKENQRQMQISLRYVF